MGKNLTSDEILTGVLAYLGILVLIPLIIIKKKNEFIKFHLKQGLTLFIAEIIIWVILTVLMIIPAIGIFFLVIAWLVWLLILVLVIISLIKALTGEMWKIPLIYDLSKKWKF